MWTPFFVKNRIAVFAFFLLLTPLVVYGAVRAFQHGANRPEDWLPDSFSESQDLIWFHEHFVSDDLLVVSWEGSDIGDPRAEAMAEFLRQPIPHVRTNNTARLKYKQKTYNICAF